MAANGFPVGEREGGNQNAALDAIPEPLGDVFLGFTCLCMKKFDRCLKRKFGGFNGVTEPLLCCKKLHISEVSSVTP